MKLNIYVDGFNLYYGCLKGTRSRWLNLDKYCRFEFRNDTINRIRYFTARVNSLANNPGDDLRQHVYLSALETLPNLEIHLGHYLSSVTRMPLANPSAAGPRTVEVMKSEEKGSDVNIAMYMLLDAFDSDCDGMVLISNDSDLAEPVRIVVSRFQLPVTVLHPVRPPRYPSAALRRVATNSLQVTRQYLARSQFPSNLTDAQGNPIRKPGGW